MGNFQDTFETRKRSFISVISICMTVPLRLYSYNFTVNKDPIKFVSKEFLEQLFG